jgi:hypothetical protein
VARCHPNYRDAHIALQEKKNGKGADWMEPVSDEQYRAAKEGTLR